MPVTAIIIALSAIQGNQAEVKRKRNTKNISL